MDSEASVRRLTSQIFVTLAGAIARYDSDLDDDAYNDAPYITSGGGSTRPARLRAVADRRGRDYGAGQSGRLGCSAYTSFIWWASAGENRDGLSEEEEEHQIEQDSRLQEIGSTTGLEEYVESVSEGSCSGDVGRSLES
jgi:hypothetical protein